MRGAVSTLFFEVGKIFSGGGATRDHEAGRRARTRAWGGGGATRDHENRRGRESPWRRLARLPFPLLRASSRAEGKSAPTLWVSRPRRTRKPACGGTRKDRCAVRTKRGEERGRRPGGGGGGATRDHEKGRSRTISTQSRKGCGAGRYRANHGNGWLRGAAPAPGGPWADLRASTHPPTAPPWRCRHRRHPTRKPASRDTEAPRKVA